MRVVALDPSLACTGVADSALPKPFTISPPAGLTGPGRLYWIQKRVLQAVEGADLVAIEGYAHGAKNQAHQLGELGGVIRLTLWCLKIRYVDAAPAHRMRIATGKGLAKKEAVLAAAIHRLGYQGHSFDEADALWLLQLALHQYGLQGAVPLPKSHLEATGRSKTEWPTREQLAEQKAS
jgi:Holliday junction resolvasome RuvABC endonuclease subunit